VKPLHFWKLDGAGNDFIGVDGRTTTLAEVRENAPRWCDRHRGIGADGVIHVVPAEVPSFAYVNADGSDAFCGNGLRCAVVLARFALGCAPFDSIRTEENDQPVFEITAAAAGWDVEVGVPAADDPVRSVALSPEWGEEAFLVRVGVPHLVLPTTLPAGLGGVDVSGRGPALRHHPCVGPDGANVNWVEERGGTFHMRTYERGVEGETLACGSGAVAVALWARTAGAASSSATTTIVAAGGDRLRVRERRTDSGSVLTLGGPASIVFEGRTANRPGT
jgi:diaminopimelate epimerase